MTNLSDISERINRSICKLSTPLFLLLMGLITLLRNGVGIFGPSWGNIKSDAPGFQWGVPSNYRSSPLIVFLRELCGANPLIWYLQQVLITLVIIAIALVVFIRLDTKDRLLARVFLILLALSPLTTILIRTVGNYDPILYLLVFIGIFFGKKRLPIIVGVLWGMSHAEAAIVSSISTLVYLRFFPFDSGGSKRATFFLRSALISGCTVLLAFMPFGGSSRLEITSQFVPISLSTFIYSLPQSVYACMGGLWSIVILFLFEEFKSAPSQPPGKPKRFFWFFAPILTALGCQVITSDGTRVALSVLAPFILILIQQWCSKLEMRENNFALVLGLISPAIIVQNIWIHPAFRQVVDFLNLPLEKG